MTLTGALAGAALQQHYAKGWAAVRSLRCFHALAIITFTWELKKWPSRAAILSAFEPVVTVTLGVLVLKESLSFIQFAGIILVLSAVVMINLAAARRKGTAGLQ